MRGGAGGGGGGGRTQRRWWATAAREGAREEGGKRGGKQGKCGSTEEVRAGEGGRGGAAPGEVDTSWGQQWGRTTPGLGRRGGGGVNAELAFAYTLTRKLAWLHVGHLIKGHQSAQAVREGLPCHASAPAVASRLCLAWQSPGTGW